MDCMKWGADLRRARDRSGLGVRKFGKMFGVSAATISRAERLGVSPSTLSFIEMDRWIYERSGSGSILTILKELVAMLEARDERQD